MKSAPRKGLYRATIPLSSDIAKIPANRLIHLTPDDASSSYAVRVAAPGSNGAVGFEGEPLSVDDEGWIKSLVELPQQGLYVVKQALDIRPGQQIASEQLLLLTFNLNGQPIGALGRWSTNGTIQFGDTAVQLTDLQLELLDSAPFSLLPPRQASRSTSPTEASSQVPTS